MLGAISIALFSVVGFVIVLFKSHALAIASGLAEVAMSGVSVMLDSTQSDDAKERAVRESGVKLVLGAWRVLWRFALALAAVALPIILANALGLVRQEDSLGVLLRIDFIVMVSVLGMALSWALRRRQSPTIAKDVITDSSSYGAGDKFVHALAFAGPGTLKRLAKIDDRIFSRTIREVSETPPIFITSLARGGTTALLNALHHLPQIATHRYCDMPFISAPLLWSKLPGHNSNVSERERAHGDGMMIGPQSPEAFDEIFWRLHWPEKYHDELIDLWCQADAKDEAQAFFNRHFRKIARLRHPESATTIDGGVRYLSKNNANIARLDLLPHMFPRSDIVVPLRGPAAHAASLLRQQQNFTNLHADDAFVLRYMRDIGHLEFGSLQRPLGFDPDVYAPYSPMEPDYWLAYWVAAFENVAQKIENIHIVTQDDLRELPQATVSALLERLALPCGQTCDFKPYFRDRPDPQPEELFDPQLLSRAKNIYNFLAESAVRG
jgi:hypothetical protein